MQPIYIKRSTIPNNIGCKMKCISHYSGMIFFQEMHNLTKKNREVNLIGCNLSYPSMMLSISKSLKILLIWHWRGHPVCRSSFYQAPNLVSSIIFHENIILERGFQACFVRKRFQIRCLHFTMDGCFPSIINQFYSHKRLSMSM